MIYPVDLDMMISGPVFRKSTGPETRLPRFIQTAAPYTHPAGKHVVFQQPSIANYFLLLHRSASPPIFYWLPAYVYEDILWARLDRGLLPNAIAYDAPPLRPGLRGVTRERHSLCLCPNRTVVPELDSHVFRVPSSGVVDEKAPRVKESREQRHAKLICM